MIRSSLVALAAITLTTPALASKETLLAAAGKRIESAYSNRDPESPFTDKTLAKLRTSTAACLQAIDEALAGGATLDDDVAMPIKQIGHARQVKNKFGAWIYVAPLREGQLYCRELAARPDVLQAQTVVSAAAGWLSKAESVRARAAEKPKLDNDASSQAGVMTSQVGPCRAAIKKATAAGVPPTATLDLPHDAKVTLGEAEATICDPLAKVAEAIIAIEDAKLEKMLAPYKAVLKGDKLKTFLDRKMIFDEIYGPGANVLDTPAKLAAAGAWFIILEGDAGLGFKYVTVRRYGWSGNKLGGVTERKGCCT